ncbi:TraR/DksA family transcriptional regulator [Roseobacter sp. EG26]|uniref:TraR/DksA family transcriptional regulator n=1 Tax=Roseobacter sp. EG26 TaxID=3412477 RepID=UPI003CE53152
MTDPRSALNDRLKALDAEDAAGLDGQKTVELDQQAIGRLSRMDALQNQAMAQAQARRRQAERQKIAAALARITEGEYGYCTDCGEEIAPARLAADPAIARCLDCTRGG